MKLILSLCALVCSASVAWAVEPTAPRAFVNTAMPTQTGVTHDVTSNDSLQAVIDRALPGDTISIQAGVPFRGNFTLPKKSNPNNRWIIIRSSNLSGVGPEGTRVGPSKASAMAKIISPNEVAAISTEPGASHYRLIGLEVTSDRLPLTYASIQLGSGEEDSLADLPHHVVIDRCYVHGQPTSDTQRGIAFNAYNSAIIDSYISEYHHLGADAQAVNVRANPGPVKIVNNYLEGAGENVLFGGAQLYISNLAISDIEFRRNLLSKPLPWGKGVLGQPTGLSVAGASATGGALSATTRYYYRIVARAPIGYNQTIFNSPSSTEVSAVPGSGRNAMTVRWSSLANATSYAVYRTTSAPTLTTRSWKMLPSVTGTSLTDLGAAGTSASQPADVGRRWVIKNLFEVKHGQRMIVDSNIMEHCWQAGQDGYAVLFTPRNSTKATAELTNPWVVVQDILFTNNIVRRSAAGIQIMGKDYSNPPVSSQITRRLKFKDNLFEEIGGSWGGTGRIVMITEGVVGSSSPVDVTFDHNTMGFSNGNSLISVSDADSVIPSFTFRNNIGYCGQYGVKAGSQGELALQQAFTSSLIFTHNLLVGCSASQYDSYPTNRVTATPGSVGFTAYSTDGASSNNYKLGSASAYRGIASDGQDPGANITGLNSATTGVRTGLPSASPSPSPSPTPTPTATSTPWGGTPAPVPGRIEAENYDVGGKDVAYDDSTPSNEYGISPYRDNSVDFQACTDPGSIPSGCGFYVGKNVAGEWLNYTVNVTASRGYYLDFRVASDYAGTGFQVEIDGSRIATVTVPDTGGWQNWQTVRVPVTLSAGRRVLKIRVTTGGYNMNFFQAVAR
jgi:hypothetical protein